MPDGPLWAAKLRGKCAFVAALKKEGAGRKDVLEPATVDADLEYTAVTAVFKRVVAAEGQDRIFGWIDSDTWRVEALIAGCIRIVNPGSVRWRVCRGRRQSRI